MGQKLIKFLVLDENSKNYTHKIYYFLFKNDTTPRSAYYTTFKIPQIKFLLPLTMQLSSYHIFNPLIFEASTFYLPIPKELYPLAIFIKMLVLI